MKQGLRYKEKLLERMGLHPLSGLVQIVLNILMPHFYLIQTIHIKWLATIKAVREYLK